MKVSNCPSGPSGVANVPAVALVPDTAAPLEESEIDGGSGLQPAVLSAAAIGCFKGNGTRARMATKGARSALKDHRAPGPDTNKWKTLLKAKRGYWFAVRVIVRIFTLFCRAGSKPLEGTLTEPLDRRAVIALFSGEREKSYQAAPKRRTGDQRVHFK